MVLFGQRWLYSGTSLYLNKSGCVRTKVVVFGQKWLYLGKSGCIEVKVVVFGQSGCIQTNWLYSGKVGLFGQGGFI